MLGQPATLAHGSHHIFRRLEHEKIADAREEIFAALQEPRKPHAQHPLHVFFARPWPHERRSHVANIVALAVQQFGEVSGQHVVARAVWVHAVDVPDALVIGQVDFSNVKALRAQQLRNIVNDVVQRLYSLM
ncbi:MAG: hypothetical protein EBQ57_09525 [Actinobacteria bacterium]|nr:hypothetical protein [Actinomycetota bacterium]